MTSAIPVRQMSMVLQGTNGTGDYRATFDVPEGQYDEVGVLIEEDTIYTWPVDITLDHVD